MPKMILMFFLLLSALLYPSGYNLKILMNSGSSQVFAVADIQKITKDATLNIQLKSGGTTSIDVAQIRKILFDTTATGIGSSIETGDIVKTFALLQNYPNPFNPTTNISFSLPEKSAVTLSVFNQLGQKVDIIADGIFSGGNHSITWNASKLNSGVYFYELKSEKFRSIKKLIFLK